MTAEGQIEGGTVRDAVEKAAEEISAAGCEEARADAEALVAHALGIEVDELSRDGSGELTPEVAGAIEAGVARRAEHEPLAYILGHERFQGIDVAVDPRVLIPRRETGLLVEVAAELQEGARAHEIGTGSGAVALALLSQRPDLKVTASDLSPEAAEVARENAARLGINLEVTVEEGLPEAVVEEDVDLVLANLPYVTDSTIFERSPEIRREPRIAVTGDCGEDGLGVIRGVLSEIPSGWRVAFEHDTHHGPVMREMLGDATSLTDYMGGERVTVGIAP
ncbi:MAG: N5-glutamine methyltransferase family protein [Solirubrobacterales bacterium]